MRRVPVRSVLTLLLALGVTVAVLVWLRELGGPEAVRARFGARAVWVSFPAHVVTTLTPLGEIVPFGVANGAAYGVAWGAGLNLAAWMVAAALQYAFGRGAAAEVNRRSLPGWLGRVPLTHPVALVDGGRGVLAPVFVDDVVAGVLAAGRAEGAEGEAFHLSGPGVPVAEFFGHYARMAGVRLRSVPPGLARAAAPVVAGVARAFGAAPPLSGRTLEYVTHPAAYSTEKAARVLGWRPAVGLDEGMARTEAWLRETGRL